MLCLARRSRHPLPVALVLAAIMLVYGGAAPGAAAADRPGPAPRTLAPAVPAAAQAWDGVAAARAGFLSGDIVVRRSTVLEPLRLDPMTAPGDRTLARPALTAGVSAAVSTWNVTYTGRLAV